MARDFKSTPSPVVVLYSNENHSSFPHLYNYSYFEPEQDSMQTPNNATTSNKIVMEDYLWVYIAPIILVLGITGNTLTLVVMTRRRMRGTTTSIYMPAMALADTLALTSGIIPEWMEACGFPIFSQVSPVACKFEKFIFYSSSDTAIWLLVLFSFDRFIAVCFPLHKRQICQPNRAKMACVAAMLVAFVKNCHVFWTRGTVYTSSGEIKSNCDRIEPYVYFEKYVRPWLAFCVVSVLPFITLCFCNLLIIRQILKIAGVRPDNSKRERTVAQTTMMCLSVSFAFLLCVTPSMVVHIGKPYWDNETNFAYNVSKTISNLLSYFSHAINFFLYCMTGAKFRKELVMLFVSRYGVRMGLQELSTTHTTYLSNGRRFTDPSLAERGGRPYRPNVSVALTEVSNQVLSAVHVHINTSKIDSKIDEE